MVDLYKFYVYSLGIKVGCQHGSDFVSSDYHHLFDLQCGLGEVLYEQFHSVLAGEGEYEVVVLEHRVRLGDYGVVAAGDGYDAEAGGVFGAQLLHESGERKIQQGRIFVKPENGYLQFSACEIHSLGAGVALELGNYLVGRDPFGIEQQLYAQFVEQQPVVGGQVILVIDPGEHLGGTHALGEQGANYVGLLLGSRVDCDEQVGFGNTGLAQGHGR